MDIDWVRKSLLRLWAEAHTQAFLNKNEQQIKSNRGSAACLAFATVSLWPAHVA
jgi:hypothetical protein